MYVICKILYVRSITYFLCMHSNDWRIIGGHAAPDGAYPYQISLQVYDQHLCGGSIMDATTILTAAHCINPEYEGLYTVKVGTVLVNEGGDVYEVAEARVHPNYSTQHTKNDIAIVKLKSPIIFNEKVQPIALETEHVDGDVECVLTGWGYLQYPGTGSDELQQVDLKTVTNTECSTMLNSPYIDETQICTLTTVGEGSCHGDSGGPLVADKQIGIVSFGIPCAIGFPDVYTRVSAYKDWIEQNRH
ncbi:hypothetical protein RI129_011273 [Pyrocoelia pectoralis]|uniref:Peptidase S1 domain-containing protein n=1 Tax=Pyrocoelia pectoralis TaxID=417401 RepID=A0AAN7ZFB8_9COLE